MGLTRKEQILAGKDLTPLTRGESYLKAAIERGIKEPSGGGGGGGSALPDYTGANDGDVLAIESGEPSWASPASGLPDYSGASDGDVLTVKEDTGEIYILEQSVTTAGAFIAEGTLTDTPDTPPAVMNVVIDGVVYAGVEFNSTTNLYAIMDGGSTVAQIIPDSPWRFVKEAGTYSVSAYEPGDLTPQWTAPSGGSGVLIATLRADVDMQSGSLTFGNCSKTGAELKTAVTNGVIPFINFTMYADNAPFANMILVIDSIDVAGDIVSFAFYDASSGSQNVIMVYADGHAVMQSD